MKPESSEPRGRPGADTRAPDGPDGRVYKVPFAAVWDELLALVARRPRWRLKHSDEEIGIITVSCRTLVFRFIDDLTIWVSLDHDGLTRVEALSRSRVGRNDFGTNARRIEGLLSKLDVAVGPENRLSDRGGPGAVRPAAPSDDGATYA